MQYNDTFVFIVKQSQPIRFRYKLYIYQRFRRPQTVFENVNEMERERCIFISIVQSHLFVGQCFKIGRVLNKAFVIMV